MPRHSSAAMPLTTPPPPRKANNDPQPSTRLQPHEPLLVGWIAGANCLRRRTMGPHTTTHRDGGNSTRPPALTTNDAFNANETQCPTMHATPAPMPHGHGCQRSHHQHQRQRVVSRNSAPASRWYPPHLARNERLRGPLYFIFY